MLTRTAHDAASVQAMERVARTQLGVDTRGLVGVQQQQGCGEARARG